jgi:hypothetical protein
VKLTFLAAMSCATTLIICGCDHKKEAVSSPQLQAEQKKIEFVPPADSTLTIERMKKWLLCNPYLDSLSVLYKDSFATTDAARQTRIQEDFIKAQDKICVRIGLPGGYPEYLWILKSASIPKNAKALDSLKLTAYK